VNIIRYNEVSSTNALMRERAKTGLHGDVIVADCQTDGKGTQGRSFFSPNGGLYFSLLLKSFPTAATDILITLTKLTAVAIRRAILSDLGIACKIKKINDIYLNGKKVCGISAESKIEGEEIKHIILGVGINVFEPEEGFTEDLRHIAAPLLPKANNEKAAKETKESLLAAVLREFFAIYNSNSVDYLIEYETNLI